MSGEKRVVMFSGGTSSYLAARRIADKHGTEGMTLLFTDTLIEDPDLYRFLDDASKDIGLPVTRIADGRTPFEVYRDERFLGNSKIAPCSKFLKQKMADDWLKANCDPTKTTVYVGLDWAEGDRIERLITRRGAQGWRYEAPMADPPYLDKDQMNAAAMARGVRPGRLYEMGFSHNNCGGMCCRGGQAHFALLLEKLPENFRRVQSEEEFMQQYLNKPVTMLTETRRGKTKALPLSKLRERLEAQQEIDWTAVGGCGCFTEDA